MPKIAAAMPLTIAPPLSAANHRDTEDRHGTDLGKPERQHKGRDDRNDDSERERAHHPTYRRDGIDRPQGVRRLASLRKLVPFQECNLRRAAGHAQQDGRDGIERVVDAG